LSQKLESRWGFDFHAEWQVVPGWPMGVTPVCWSLVILLTRVPSTTTSSSGSPVARPPTVLCTATLGWVLSDFSTLLSRVLGAMFWKTTRIETWQKCPSPFARGWSKAKVSPTHRHWVGYGDGQLWGYGTTCGSNPPTPSPGIHEQAQANQAGGTTAPSTTPHTRP